MAEQNRNSKLKSSIVGFLSVLWDLILLNFLWLLCSLPVLTIGPATSALFSVTIKLARDDDVQTLQDFFRALKGNFRQAFVLGLVFLFAAAVIFSDGVYAFSVDGPAKIVFGLLTGFLCALLLTYFSYVFALSARYENRWLSQIINAYLLAFCAPGKTVLMWIIYLAPAALLLLLPAQAAAYTGFLYLMMGVSGPVLLGSMVLIQIFERFAPNKNAQERETDEHES